MTAQEGEKMAARCVGWHCLTTAQKFGIIFSAAVVAVVLGIAWMYYLGRVASSRNIRRSVRLPGGRRICRNTHLPEALALGDLPVAQSWPGRPPQVIYQPVIYSFDSPGGIRAHPYFVMGPYQPIRPPPMAYIPTRPQAAFARHGHQGVVNITAQANLPKQLHVSPTPPTDAPYQPRPLTWAQRMNRVLGLPLGRASTVASSISTERDNLSRRNSRESSQSAEHTAQGDAASVHTQSSNAATVHSDDYDIIQPTSRQALAIEGGDNQASKLKKGFYRNVSKPVATAKSSASRSRSDGSMLHPAPANQTDPSLRESAAGSVTNKTSKQTNGSSPNRLGSHQQSECESKEAQHPKQDGHVMGSKDTAERQVVPCGEGELSRAAQSPIRLRMERESARSRWDMRSSESEPPEDDGFMGPLPPSAVDQGRGIYVNQ